MSKKIEIDSVSNNIFSGFENYKILHHYEMKDCLDILLTNNQKNKLYGDETIDFIVGEKRFLKFIEYIDKDNIKNNWRVDQKIVDKFYKNKYK